MFKLKQEELFDTSGIKGFLISNIILNILAIFISAMIIFLQIACLGVLQPLCGNFSPVQMMLPICIITLLAISIIISFQGLKIKKLSKFEVRYITLGFILLLLILLFGLLFLFPH